MDKVLALLTFVLAIGVMTVAYPDGPLAVLVGSFCAVIAVLIVNKNFQGDEKIFVRRVFIISLMLRVILATATYVFGLQSFFGGDSITYDESGFALYTSWFGDPSTVDRYYLSFATRASGSGWGMSYLVAGIYTLVGRNPLATQLFNSVLGAATACLIYVCAKRIFNNIRVAKFSAIFVGFFPSLVLWSSQGLKDGIICFLLTLAINNVILLQKRFNYFDVTSLLLSLVGIYALRFYIVFAFAVAILGSFILGAQKSAGYIGRQVLVLVFITLGLLYLGVLNSAQRNLETFGNLETLQRSRLDQAKSAESGFGQDIDVSTSTGAIQALPIGLTYLLLAPFPWDMNSLRQAITFPEMLIWWTLFPFLISGVWYIIKNKLRESLAILLLTLLLTVSYAVFQGNIGTAYRMRAQMQIFYFIFIAVGLTIWLEKRENKNLRKIRR